MMTNAQSLGNKIDELRTLAVMLEPDVIAITETWTNDTTGNSIWDIRGYEILARNDRNDTEGGRGGGILIYAVNGLGAWSVEPNTSFNKCATIRISTRTDDIQLHVIYRSPNSKRENDEELCRWVTNMRGTNILTGDFNFPDIGWREGKSRARGRSFYEATAAAFMDQHVTQPTHVSGNLLDLVLCNKEGLISNTSTYGRLGKSDHEIVTFEVEIGRDVKADQRASSDYGRAKFDEMRGAIGAVPWGALLSGKSVNVTWQAIRDQITSEMNRHIPIRKRKKRNEPPWLNAATKRVIDRKRAAWRKWRQTMREEDKSEYRRVEAEAKGMVRNRKNGWERDVAKHRKKNPKFFFSQINRAKKSRSGIGPLTDNGGHTITDLKQQAQVLNQQYASVFTKRNDELPSARRRGDPNIQLHDIDINEAKVGAAIDALKEQSAAGPDGIPARVLKEVRNELVKPLNNLFKKSFEEGKIPDDWPEAIISPIFKKEVRRSQKIIGR